MILTLVLLALQQVPQRTLNGPPTEIREGFRSIDDVRVLRSGELLMTGALQRDTGQLAMILSPRLYAVAFPAGTIRAVGEQGRAPHEYVNAGRLLAGPGDTTWMTDEVRPSVFVIDPDGQPRGGAPFPPHVLPEEGRGNYSLRFLRTDSAGNFYDSRSARSAEKTTSFRDSLVVRYRERLNARTDTLVWLYETINRTPSPGFLGFLALPYHLQDVWRVAPNGDVIVIRAHEYRVDRVSRDGVLTPGPPIPHERRPVTKADKEAHIRDLEETQKRARGSGLPRTDYRKVLAKAEWPTHKPPFTGRVVLAADAVWIPMTPARPEDPIVYDVVGFDGSLRERVLVPQSVEIVAIGRDAVFTTRRNKGFLYLQRWNAGP